MVFTILRGCFTGMIETFTNVNARMVRMVHTLSERIHNTKNTRCIRYHKSTSKFFERLKMCTWLKTKWVNNRSKKVHIDRDRENRFFVATMRPNLTKFDQWDQINIPKKGGYCTLSQCENIAHIFLLILLGEDSSMTLNLKCPSNTSSHFSWITLYPEHALSQSYWYFPRFLLNTFILWIICPKPNFTIYDHAYCSLYDILVYSLHD